ncbi:hypothetical protein Ancab_005152 [Ancistrocladus abbreviatus]
MKECIVDTISVCVDGRWLLVSVAEEDGMRYVQSGVEEASGPVGRTCDQSRTNLKFSPMSPSISMVSCTLEEAPQSPLEIGNSNGGVNDSGGSGNNVHRCNDVVVERALM